MKTVTLKIHESLSDYSQTPQTSSLQFSLLERIGDNSFEELHTQVMCREYFGDAVVAAHLDQNVPNIYGFSLRDRRMAIDETILSLSLTKENYKCFIQRLNVLNRIEKKMKISLTNFYKTDNPTKEANNIYKIVSVGDKKWSSSPLLISIYTLILRSFCYKTNKKTFKNHIKDLIDKYEGNDSLAFREITSLIDLEHLLVNIDKVLGSNPLTGINDSEFKEKVLENNYSFYNQYTTTYISHVFNYEAYTCYWNIHNNHSAHGILSFINNFKYISTNSPYTSYRLIGILWAYNYNLLLNK